MSKKNYKPDGVTLQCRTDDGICIVATTCSIYKKIRYKKNQKQNKN